MTYLLYSSYFLSKNKYCRDIVITVKPRKNIIFYLEANVVKSSLVLYDDALAKAYFQLPFKGDTTGMTNRQSSLNHVTLESVKHRSKVAILAGQNYLKN